MAQPELQIEEEEKKHLFVDLNDESDSSANDSSDSIDLSMCTPEEDTALPLGQHTMNESCMV